MLRMEGITKSYGAVRANRGIDLAVGTGRIVGLLGENGSGKTTLMNVLFGMVRADAGHITFKGRSLRPGSPRDAIAAGIGMIHQHFMLVPAMTVTDNVMLALDAAGAWLRPRAVADRIREVSRTWRLEVDPDARVGDLPLGLQQRVEILKAILRGAELLILDEPTSNLSPPEVTVLLDFLRRFRGEGRAVVFISHKLAEVLELCDEVVVLRDGEVVGTRPVAGASGADLARMMVGREVASGHEWTPREAGAELLLVVDLHGRDAAGVERLSGVSFSVRAGEVFAIAGVDGNGQAELAEAIGGLVPPAGGHVYARRRRSHRGRHRRAPRCRHGAHPRRPRVHRPHRRHDDCRERRAARLRPAAAPARCVARRYGDPPGRARPRRALRHPRGRRGRTGALAVRRQSAEGRPGARDRARSRASCSPCSRRVASIPGPRAS